MTPQYENRLRTAGPAAQPRRSPSSMSAGRPNTLSDTARNTVISRELSSGPLIASAGRLNAPFSGLGNAAAARLFAGRESARRSTYPWIGEIEGTWAAALRKSSKKDEDEPYSNISADLPRGTQVRVINRKGGWLHVVADIDGVLMEGFVSQELVRYVEEDAYRLEPLEIHSKVPTVAEAFVELKRAEADKAKGAEFTQQQVDQLELCASVLRATSKYVVDESTWAVDFDRKTKRKVEVTTIEDFILFVQSVERAYPRATPAEIVSEVRQAWFSDPRWAVLVASQGIRADGGDLVDIETQEPIATAFDMRKLAPNSAKNPEGGLTLKTAMGEADVSHVMAGLDAAISGSPASYPEKFLEKLEKHSPDDYDTFENEAAYEALRRASATDVRDFATWAGDLGQAYADFLYNRYRRGDQKKSLADWVGEKAPPDQLLGDIHGYIIRRVWSRMTNSPTPGDGRISSALRDMYLVRKPIAERYAALFAAVPDEPIKDLKRFITQRTIAFARLWFAKASYADTGGIPWSGGAAMIEEHSKGFDQVHDAHEANGDAEDKLEVLVDNLVMTLSGSVR